MKRSTAQVMRRINDTLLEVDQAKMAAAVARLGGVMAGRGSAWAVAFCACWSCDRRRADWDTLAGLCDACHTELIGPRP